MPSRLRGWPVAKFLMIEKALISIIFPKHDTKKAGLKQILKPA